MSSPPLNSKNPNFKVKLSPLSGLLKAHSWKEVCGFGFSSLRAPIPIVSLFLKPSEFGVAGDKQDQERSGNS